MKIKASPATPQRVTFSVHDPKSVEVVALAQFGLSTDYIQEKTGLTTSQITYRLRKAKLAEGLPDRVTYRRQWRSGESFAAKLVIQQNLMRVATRVQRTLPGKIARPPVQFARAA